MSALGAIILAGGRGQRFAGASKPDVRVDGVRMIDHVLGAVAALGDEVRASVLVAPPEVQVYPCYAPPGLLRTMEHPPRSGPAAGVLAGLAALDEAQAIDGATPTAQEERDGATLVLSCDIPRIATALPRLISTLEAAPGGVDAVCLGTPREGGGTRTQFLAAIYRTSALRRAEEFLRSTGGVPGASMKALVRPLHLQIEPARGDEGVDVDSWADWQALQ